MPPATHRFPWDWGLALRSCLYYTLAFNLTFFIQELFLVLPKALTPGLRPTLFHNNHRWEGEHAVAALFQGTGAVATVLVALLCAWLLRRGVDRSQDARLLLLWMTWCGLFMALPQVAIGALSPASDVGMAMGYLRLGDTTRTIAGVLSLAAVPFVALWLLRPLLGIATTAAQVDTAAARTRLVFLVATVPLLVGTLLIVPFRLPREWLEVLLPPAWVALLGLPWLQAFAWRVRNVTPGALHAWPMAVPVIATLFLLLAFQLVLRPGIPFY